MRVVVPFVPGMLAEATRLALRQEYIPVEYVEVGDDGRYADLLESAFDWGDRFIVVEQDIVPWWGAIGAIWDCPEPWCAYGYMAEDLIPPGNVVPLGCAKFDPRRLPLNPVPGVPRRSWSILDVHITQQLYVAGVVVHQHHPGVRNLNPLATA